MSLKCILGLHYWNGCKCEKCGKTRDQAHDWSKDCEKCDICGKTRSDAHDWSKNCEKCEKCGKTSSDYLLKKGISPMKPPMCLWRCLVFIIAIIIALVPVLAVLYFMKGPIRDLISLLNYDEWDFAGDFARGGGPVVLVIEGFLVAGSLFCATFAVYIPYVVSRLVCLVNIEFRPLPGGSFRTWPRGISNRYRIFQSNMIMIGIIGAMFSVIGSIFVLGCIMDRKEHLARRPMKRALNAFATSIVSLSDIRYCTEAAADFPVRIRGKIAVIDWSFPSSHPLPDRQGAPRISQDVWGYLPSNLQALTPEEAETLVFLIWDREYAFRYQGGETAYRIVCHIVVADRKERKRWSLAKSFVGGEPSPTGRVKKYITDIYGSTPNKEIATYIAELPRLPQKGNEISGYGKSIDKGNE